MRRRFIISGALIGIALGIPSGLGIFTFIYAEGASYLTNDPRACANCHVMQGHYDAWAKSSHHAVATCNDCHTPASFFGKYQTKAINGYNHSMAFTMGGFHEPIQITPRNHEITENACRKCHADIVAAIDGVHGKGKELSCVRCHSSVGHLR
jgi:cytochrome c nitrite reductase small subunit